VAVLMEARRPHWAEVLGAARRSAEDRVRIQRAHETLRTCCAQPAWNTVANAMGAPLGIRMQSPPQLPAGLIHPAIVSARLKLHGGATSPLFSIPSADDTLHSAERDLWQRDGAVLASGLYCPTVGTLLSQCFFVDYPFTMMAS